MRYFKKWKDGNDWEEVTEGQVKLSLSGAYVDVEMAMDSLHENKAISTQWAIFNCESEDDTRI